jgi:hypothetical protein
LGFAAALEAGDCPVAGALSLAASLAEAASANPITNTPTPSLRIDTEEGTCRAILKEVLFIHAPSLYCLYVARPSQTSRSSYSSGRLAEVMPFVI